MHYNTTNETGEVLKQYSRKARNQEEVVLEIFKKYRRLTASECHAFFMRYTTVFGVPLTSIRRSITDLTKAGKLLKTGVKKEGQFGRSEYVWMINPEG